MCDPKIVKNSKVRSTGLAGFPVGIVIGIGPELDTPKGDRFAYVQFRDWRVVPVLMSELRVQN